MSTPFTLTGFAALDARVDHLVDLIRTANTSAKVALYVGELTGIRLTLLYTDRERYTESCNDILALIEENRGRY